MIVIHIIAKQETQAHKILHILLHKKFLLDAMVSKKLIYETKKETEEITFKKHYLIFRC